ncbi:unnamed protein product [Didymodactylos carnosus]|uniref:Uncharacterized protein n=1 Tax=Didymodactylos carnosus TaxID=1234261 RepID=A0A815UAK5_9BILA|nr:unnamed protein product [Didymodactylos carnosus]CAF1612575.1 unnamed protein product [Didymodactylos carnosus]CAF4376982.1 unnamed protein product [Didymodactylos carnosus]CAF4427259.1 unnamed protein product [Didymodactylos carnosus]
MADQAFQIVNNYLIQHVPPFFIRVSEKNAALMKSVQPLIQHESQPCEKIFTVLFGSANDACQMYEMTKGDKSLNPTTASTVIVKYPHLFPELDNFIKKRQN